nr:MAG TPA: hypothetical protein [Caudoviricetes sp.]
MNRTRSVTEMLLMMFRSANRDRAKGEQYAEIKRD